MLGLGWTEMLVIGVVALIVIGPKDLPVVMGRVGKVIGQIQRMGRDFQREINKTTGLDEVRNLRSSITSPLKKTADEIRREFNAIGKDGKPTPSGVIKPTDPKVESVVDAIQQQAGMASATKAAVAAPAGDSIAEPTTSVSEPAKTAAAKPVSVRKAAKPGPVKAARRPLKPVAAEVEAPEAKPASVRKPRVKTAKAKAAAPVIDAEGAPVKPAKKPRAPRKKSAPPAGDTE